MCELIDGKKLAADVIAEIKESVSKMSVKPCLAVVLVGDDAASEVYVRKKTQACERVGFESKLVRFNVDISEESLLEEIEKMNNDSGIHGFIVQLPIPKHIDQKKVIDAISPLKDADGFTTTNLGRLFVNDKKILPATSKAIMHMLDSTGVELKGKNAVVVGASNIVGKPTAMLLLNRQCTPTICHIETTNLAEYTKYADILVVAVGKQNVITKDMVKKGAIVIDVGINRTKEGKICGDVAKDVQDVAAYLSPVPGGVGPMTVAMLLKNTLECMKLQSIE